MRVIYSGLFYCVLPAVFLRLLWRGIKAPDYRLRWRERVAIYPQPTEQSVVWFHAVSVGEVEALAPLVRILLNRYPRQRLLITATTPTGSARVKAVFQDRVDHVYLPYDLPDAVDRFMRHFKPRLAVFAETEIWPNLYADCAKNAVPLYLINARLSEKSVRGYQKIASLIRPALANITLVAAQSRQDVARFQAIGMAAGALLNMGNLKFDVSVSPELLEQGRQLKASLFAGRFVWLLASSHDDEEGVFFESYRQLKPRIPELLLVIAPRHPERFQTVAQLCQRAELNAVLRSSSETCRSDTDVYLVDTLGELKLFYAGADVAFVGGSMVPVGGHNVLEPAAIGVPIMFGPGMDNFQEITEGILEKNAAVQCQSKADIVDKLYGLYANSGLRQALIENAKAFVKENQGATEKLAALLGAHIAP